MNIANIAVIGAGNMGTSLVGGLVDAGYSPQKICLTNPHGEKLALLNHEFGIKTTTQNRQAVAEADVVILAVKPKVLQQVAVELADIVQTNKPLIISVAAGVRETSLQRWLGGNMAIVRAMPNTPSLIGCGAAGLYANPFVTQAQCDLAESILRSVGIVVWIKKEEVMNTVTALSGCGPAYFFLIMEALQQAAVAQGLTKEEAHLLTLQTALGAARMALNSEQSVAELRQRVASPGGTTEQGLKVLEEGHIRELLAKTLAAAKHRGEEIADMLDKTN